MYRPDPKGRSASAGRPFGDLSADFVRPVPNLVQLALTSGRFRSGPGHNSVAFTLTRYGGLFEDGSEAAVDRLDTLLGGASKDSDNVLQMDTRKLR